MPGMSFQHVNRFDVSGGAKQTQRGFSRRKSSYQHRMEHPGPKARPAGAEGAVQCVECEYWIVALKNDPTRPVSHAAGGYNPSPMHGHPACPGSGSLG